MGFITLKQESPTSGLLPNKGENTMKEKVFAIAGLAGSLIASLFGGFDAALVALMISMGVDYLTGLIVAGIFHKSRKTENGALESNAGWKGLFKKGVVLLIVLVACQLDIVIGSSFIRDAVVISFIANEALSVTENAGLMGIPIHPTLKKAIEILNNKSNEAKEDKNE